MTTGTSATSVSTSTVNSWIRGHLSPAPSICKPPWAGGESLREVHLTGRVPVWHQWPLPGTNKQADRQSQQQQHAFGHHQLLGSASWTGWTQARGHFDHLLGDRSVSELEHAHKSAPICCTGASRIRNMGAQSANCSTVCRWAHSRGPSSSATLAGRLPLRLGASRTSTCAATRTSPPSPGHLQSPWRCVVVILGQGHGDAHPRIPQVSTEASLSLPLCGTNVFCHRGRPYKVHQHERSLCKPRQHSVVGWLVGWLSPKRSCAPSVWASTSGNVWRRISFRSLQIKINSGRRHSESWRVWVDVVALRVVFVLKL